ncbi:hypothetical protein Hokovirus_2_229 [Hokovirus HKV1]|uniref:Uncharacterized protein n=1 Tax=Hokovirus HKV1 TaxID=1977638 RepID=A0A1V0SG55_9VIRU|nr:hypothetical protein Hokovirus_2_229 [Hokovirus HKV1]
MDNLYCEHCYQKIDSLTNCISVTDNIKNINEKNYIVHKECLHNYSKYTFNKQIRNKSLFQILFNKWKLITMSIIFICLCLLIMITSCIYINNVQDDIFNNDNDCYQYFYNEFYQAKIILIINVFVLAICIIIILVHLIIQLVKKYNKYF